MDGVEATTGEEEQARGAACVRCHDEKVDPLEPPGSRRNRHLLAIPCKCVLCGECASFVMGSGTGAGVCPVHRAVRVARVATRDELRLEAWCRAREDVCKEWNLARDDFESAAEYDAFLEQREALVSALVDAASAFGKEAAKKTPEWVTAVREKFRKEHEQRIVRRAARLLEERSRIVQRIKEEEKERKERLERFLREDMEERRREEERKRAENDARLGGGRKAKRSAAGADAPATEPQQGGGSLIYVPFNPFQPRPLPQQPPRIPVEERTKAALAGGARAELVRERSAWECARGWALT